MRNYMVEIWDQDNTHDRTRFQAEDDQHAVRQVYAWVQGYDSYEELEDDQGKQNLTIDDMMYSFSDGEDVVVFLFDCDSQTFVYEGDN